MSSIYAFHAPPNHTYYFHFGQSTVKPDASIRAALKAQILYLIQHPHARIRLEGHTDERGTREYNMHLGWLRVHTIANAFIRNGVHSTQLDLMSYGEERPAVLGHDERAWSKNRRVNLIHERL